MPSKPVAEWDFHDLDAYVSGLETPDLDKQRRSDEAEEAQFRAHHGGR
jgi:hypothetical protein